MKQKLISDEMQRITAKISIAHQWEDQDKRQHKEWFDRHFSHRVSSLNAGTPLPEVGMKVDKGEALLYDSYPLPYAPGHRAALSLVLLPFVFEFGRI